MKKSKLDYSAPEAEVFVVRVERGLCQSPGNYQTNGTLRGNVKNAEDYSFDSWD